VADTGPVSATTDVIQSTTAVAGVVIALLALREARRQRLGRENRGVARPAVVPHSGRPSKEEPPRPAPGQPAPPAARDPWAQRSGPLALFAFLYSAILAAVLTVVRFSAAGAGGQVIISVALLVVIAAGWLVIRVRRDQRWSFRLLYLLVITACGSVVALVLGLLAH
jgi:hypothetical protein